MKIAVTSFNSMNITGPAKACGSFLIYQIENKQIMNKSHIRLSQSERFDQLKQPLSKLPEHPLHGINCLITESLGQGMFEILDKAGIETLSTNGSDPDGVILAYLKLLPTA